jgi:hypothetical protein
MPTASTITSRLSRITMGAAPIRRRRPNIGRACQQSVDRASYAEAIAHFETGLARLPELPDDDRRTELELDLRNSVRLALVTIKGYGSPEGEQSAARAMELAQRPGINQEKSWLALVGVLELLSFGPTFARRGN